MSRDGNDHHQKDECPDNSVSDDLQWGDIIQEDEVQGEEPPQGPGCDAKEQPESVLGAGLLAGDGQLMVHVSLPCSSERRSPGPSDSMTSAICC